MVPNKTVCLFVCFFFVFVFFFFFFFVCLFFCFVVVAFFFHAKPLVSIMLRILNQKSLAEGLLLNTTNTQVYGEIRKQYFSGPSCSKRR